MRRQQLRAALWILAVAAAAWAACAAPGEPPSKTAKPAGGHSADSPYRPSVFFIDIEAGPTKGGPNNLGAPVSIFGKGFGAARGGSRVTIGGIEVAAYLVWGANNAHNPSLDMIVVQPGSRATGGPVVVTVNGQPSNADAVFAPNAGHIYYVAGAGSDSAACSASDPCATILHTVSSVLQPGDMLLVRGGTYSEGEVWIRAEQGGRPGQPKTVKNYPGEEAYFGNAQRDVLVDASYVTVSGLNFRNGKSLNAVGWASRNQAGARFVNNTFSGNIAWAAIDTHGSDHVIAGNVCEVSGSSVGTMGHCYYVSQGSNQKILYNVGSGPPGYGLHLYDERRDAADFQRIIRNVLVEGNVFKNSTERSGMIVAMSDQGGYGNRIENVTIRNNIFTGNNHAGLVIQGITRDLKVHNNTFYQNGRQGLYLEGDPNLQQVDVRNNLFYQSANSACRSNCEWFALGHIQAGESARNVTLAGNSYHPGTPVVLGNRDGNPVTGQVRFADAPGLDFHLLPGSAAIDRGTALPGVPADFDGRPRPQGNAYDTGAFEYVPRAPALTSVVNGATMLPGPLAPGGVVVLFGWHLGPREPALVQMEEGTATTSLGGTRVLLDGAPLSLFYAAENQVTALLPYELATAGQAIVEVEVGGERSNPVDVGVAATAPGVFTVDGSGQGQGLVINEDGSVNSPSNPARKSSVVVFYAGGLGRTDPPAVSGRAARLPLVRPLATVSVWCGGLEAGMLYAGTAWGLLTNVFQVNAQLPLSTEEGDAVSLVVRAGEAASREDVTLAIR